MIRQKVHQRNEKRWSRRRRESAFSTLKKGLMTAPALKPFNLDLPSIDASAMP